MRRKMHVTNSSRIAGGQNGRRPQSRDRTDLNAVIRHIAHTGMIEQLELRCLLAAQLSFSAAPSYTASSSPDILAVGKLNNDAYPDVAVVNYESGSSSHIDLLLGNGNGTFRFASTFNVAEGRVDTIRIGDYNNDGKNDVFVSLDYIVSNVFASHIEIFPGNGNGTVQARLPNIKALTVGGGPISDFALTDVNKDGKLDMAIGRTAGFYTMLGNGAGNFSDGPEDVNHDYAGVVLPGDFNGDGRLDFAVSDHDPDLPGYRLHIKLRDAGGGFLPDKLITLKTSPAELAGGDFNGDGKTDIAIGEWSVSPAASWVELLTNDGAGNFSVWSYDMPWDPTSIEVADFDYDFKLDLAVSSRIFSTSPTRNFAVLRGNNNGTLNAPTPIPIGDDSSAYIYGGDFNVDGRFDILVRRRDNEAIQTYLNTAVFQNRIQGIVWNDTDRDQTRDAGEAGIGGRTVYEDVNNNGALDANEAKTTTAANGSWELLVPDGTHTIREVLPGGWVQTAPFGSTPTKSTSYSVTVSNRQTRSGWDFGTFERGTVSGFIFKDPDANALFNPPYENGLPNSLVFADLNNNGSADAGEPFTYSEADGAYGLKLAPGSYVIRNPTPAGYTTTTFNATSVVVPNGGQVTNINFGHTLPATISGRVYYDYAANGRVDESEDVGVGGLQVFLDSNNNGKFDAGEPSTTSSTSADAAMKGGYKFTGLYPRTYIVRLVKPAGYKQISPIVSPAPVGDAFVTFAFGGFDTFYTDFGVIRPVLVSGRAYRDSNANGAIDAGETGLADLGIFIDYDGDGLSDLNEPYGLTDASGNYTLTSSRQGTFNVRAIKRSGFNATVPGSSLYSVVFTYGAATTTGKNFGFREGAFNTSPFNSPININTGANPTALAAGDFNGGGKQDFIVASNSSISQVFLGQGNGLFTQGQQLSIGDSTRYMIAVDVSGDGKPDLIAANEAFDFGAAVLIGNGNGTFKAAVNYAVTTNTYGVAAADFTGDGKRDLAYVGTSDNRVAILVNKGTGAFNAATFVNNVPGGKSIFAGDVNNDTKQDLVVTDPFSNAISVLLGNGNGTFTKTANNVTGGLAQPNFVTLADFNKDGKLDLVAINEFSDEIRVKLGNGNGTFQTGKSFATGETPTQVAVLDIDRDGFLDLIVSCRSDGTTDISGGVSILRGRGDGTFVDQQIRTAHTSPTAVAIADYNGDTKLDIIAANFFSDDVSLLVNGTPGALSSIKGTVWNDTDNDGVIDSGESGLGGQTVFADVDNDGVYDLGERVTRTASNGTYALLDLPAATYQMRVVVPANLVQSSPALRAANTVVLAAGQAATGKNIGLTPILVVGAYVFDDRSATATGAWTRTTGTGQYGGDYIHNGNTGQGSKSIRYDLKLPAAGYYEVTARWVAAADRANNVPIDITTATGKRTVTVNQRVNGATWVSLGTYFFNATGGIVNIRTTGANGFVVADGVRLTVATPTIVTKDNADASGITKTGTWITATTPTGYNGANYLHDGNPATKGGRSVRFTPTLASGGVYEIFGRWTAGADRASNARYDIVTATGTTSVFANQRTNGSMWVSLGFFDVNPATVSVTIRNDAANGLVVADAVRFVRVA